MVHDCKSQDFEKNSFSNEAQLQKIKAECRTLGRMASKSPHPFDHRRFLSLIWEILSQISNLPAEPTTQGVDDYKSALAKLDRTLSKAPLLRSYFGKGGCFPMIPHMPPFKPDDDQIPPIWPLVILGVGLTAAVIAGVVGYCDGYEEGLKDGQKGP